jgi:stearoyl-CoA desaturase (delta-9 desaturase)
VVALIPVGIGLATGNFWGHLVLGLIVRIVLTHHTTFLINSAAHLFGSRPYTDANSARDNWLLAPLTYGEGFHNFHHMWQWDYRNGARWYQWDSTKWILNLLGWAGLVSQFRRVPDAAIRRARLAMEEKKLRERLALSSPGVALAMAARLASARSRLDLALASFQERRDGWEAKKAEWKNQRSARAEQWRAIREEWKAAMAAHREELRAAWRDWREARLEARQVLAYA